MALTPEDIEPRIFQKEVFDRITEVPRKTLLQLPRPTVIGIDLAQEGGDHTSIVEAIKGKNGDMFIIDEYANFPDYKWYRNPIKWWKWRKLMKVIDAQIAKGKKDGTIWTSWDN